MMTVEDFLIRINSDVGGGVAGIGRLTQGLNTFQNVLRGVVTGFSVKKLWEQTVGTNAEMEQNMASFEVLLGGIEKAQARMDELVQYANTTPFTLPQVVTAEKRLLAFGVAAKETAKVLPALGDISMGNAEKLNLVSLAYGQVITNQRLYGAELRQFAENGVPLLAELANQFGVSEAKMKAMVEEGKVGSNEVTKAIMDMTSEGGKFYGMMDKQSKTFNGLFSTLKDQFATFGRMVGTEIFDALKEKQSEFMGKWKEWSEDGTLKKAASTLSDFLMGVVNLLIKGIEFLAKHGKEVIAVIGAYVALTVALKAAAIAQAAMNVAAMANPYVAIAAALVAVVGGLIAYNAAKKEEERQTYETLNATRQELNETDNLVNEHELLSKKLEKTTEEKARLHEIEVKLAELYPASIDGIDGQNQKYTTQIDLVKALNAEKRKEYEENLKVRVEKSWLDLDSWTKQKAALEDNRKSLEKLRDTFKGFAAVDTGKEKKRDLDAWEAYNKQIEGLDKKRDDLNAKIESHWQTVKEADMLQNPDLYNFSFSDAYTNMEVQRNKEPEKVNEPYVKDKKTKKTSYKNEPLDNALAELEHKKALNQISFEDEIKTLQKIKSAYAKIQSEKMDIDERVYTARQAIMTRDYQNSVKWITNQKELGKLTAEQELAAWKRVHDTQKNNTEAVTESNKNIYRIKKELADKEYQSSVKWINDQKDIGKLSAKEEIGAWQRVYDKQKSNSEAMLEASKNIYRLKKDLAEKEERESKERSEKALKEAKEQLTEQVNDYIDLKRKKIEADYQEQEDQEEMSDRDKKRSELLADEQKYQFAATEDGQKKLKQIRDDLANLEKEENRDKREKEKQKKLEDLEDEKKRMLKVVEELTNESVSTFSAADANLKAYLNSASQLFADNQDSFMSTTIQKLSNFVRNYKSIASEISMGESGGMSIFSGGAASNKNVNVTWNDYGNKILNGVGDIRSYGREIYGSIANLSGGGG